MTKLAKRAKTFAFKAIIAFAMGLKRLRVLRKIGQD
jgi:hypothetical protein